MTCALGLGATASASAGEVTLWACHGPDGAPLGAAPFGGAQTFGNGCTDTGTGFEAGGVSTVPGDANGIGLRVMNGLMLKRVQITRRTTGLGTEGGAGSYAATFRYYTGPRDNRTLHTADLDASSTDVSGDVTKDAPASDYASDAQVTFKVTGAGTAADIQRVGLTVDDPADPTASVGGIATPHMSAPAIDPKKAPGPDNDGLTHVAVWANDLGVGLWKAVLYVDGVEAGKVEYVNEGGAGARCVQALDTGAPLPLDNDCQLSSNKDITLDTKQWADGAHTLAVKLYDASGRVADVLKDYKTEFVNGKDPKNCSPTCNAPLSIGSGSSSQQNGGGNGNGGSGGVAGESTTSCNSPRLSMELSQKPLKVAKGVLVLRSGKRYRFRGKLTCLVGGKRRSAPVKTPIELFNTIGKRTYRKGGATVRANGKITIILAYKSSRTLVFRYTNPDGRRTQVKLKIKVVKRAR